MVVVKNGKVQIHVMVPKEHQRILSIYCDRVGTRLATMLANFVEEQVQRIENNGGPYNCDQEEE